MKACLFALSTLLTFASSVAVPAASDSGLDSRRDFERDAAKSDAAQAFERRNDTDRAAPAKGFDIGYNPKVNWPAIAASGTSFAYILATEGSVNIAQPFKSHYQAAHKAGLIRGAYHIARLYSSTGTEQAAFFLANGGRWKPDGSTLPGALWIEFAPSRDSCYGFTPQQTVAWIQDFSNAYKAATHRRPILKTNANFWTTCAGNSAAFAQTHDLWLTQPGSGFGSPNPLPGGWAHAPPLPRNRCGKTPRGARQGWTIWQYKDLGISPVGASLGNLDVFNGDKNALECYAVGQD